MTDKRQIQWIIRTLLLIASGVGSDVDEACRIEGSMVPHTRSRGMSQLVGFMANLLKLAPSGSGGEYGKRANLDKMHQDLRPNLLLNPVSALMGSHD